MPGELTQARVIEALAQRYHVLPSRILAEDVGLLRHVALVGLTEEDSDYGPLEAD